MTMSDPIADMLTRIRNASQARHSSCDMPFSKIKLAIAEVLRDEGYIESFEERGEGIHKVLRVHLRYAPGGRGRDPILMGIKRISKPGPARLRALVGDPARVRRSRHRRSCRRRRAS